MVGYSPSVPKLARKFKISKDNDSNRKRREVVLLCGLLAFVCFGFFWFDKQKERRYFIFFFMQGKTKGKKKKFDWGAKQKKINLNNCLPLTQLINKREGGGKQQHNNHNNDTTMTFQKNNNHTTTTATTTTSITMSLYCFKMR